MELLAQIRAEMAIEANVRKAYLYRFLHNFQLWWPIWVIYLQQERGLSLTQITLLDAPFWLLIVFAEVPTGAVADRFGRKTSLAIGGLLFGVAVFVFGVAESYPIILVSYAAWGLAITFQSGADTAILYDSLKKVGREEEFQKINGRLWAITSFAVLIAILVGAPLAAATSLAFPIIVSAFIGLACVPVALWMYEPRDGETEPEPYFRMVSQGVRDAWAQPALRYIMLFSGVMFTAVFAPMIFMQPFLAEHGVSTENLGLWQAPVRAAGMVAALMAYRFVSAAGEKAAFFAMPLTLGVCYLLLAGVNQVWIVLAFLPVGMIAGSQNPVLASYINRRIPSERRATMLSVQSLVASILIAGTEPAAGLLADEFGLRATFLVFGAVTAIVAPAVLLLWSRADAAEMRVAREPAGVAPEATEATEVVPVS
jgi:MFS family permease